MLGSVIFIAPVVCVFQFNNCRVNLDGNTVLLWVLYYFTFYWQQQQLNTIHFGLEILSVKLTSLDLYLMIMFLSISKNTTINHIILRLFFFSLIRFSAKVWTMLLKLLWLHKRILWPARWVRWSQSRHCKFWVSRYFFCVEDLNYSYIFNSFHE